MHIIIHNCVCIYIYIHTYCLVWPVSYTILCYLLYEYMCYIKTYNFICVYNFIRVYIHRATPPEFVCMMFRARQYALLQYQLLYYIISYIAYIHIQSQHIVL